MDDLDTRRALEIRLEQLQAMRAARAVAQRRWKVVVVILGIVLSVALISLAFLQDLDSQGVSKRSPVYWAVGLLAIATVPAVYVGLNRMSGSTSDGGDSSRSVAELDTVIRHIKQDLVKTGTAAPDHSVSLVGAEKADGAVSISEPSVDSGTSS